MSRENIKNTLSIIRLDGEVIEVRIPKAGYNGKQVYSGYFNDLAMCASIVEKYNGIVPAIYVTVNPVNPALLARSSNRIDEKSSLTTQDIDITKRAWLYIDIDPIRPAGISSTDNEHSAAIQKAIFINEQQKLNGWVDGIICDSGNGASLLYKIDLPNDIETTTLIQNTLKAFDYLYSDNKISVDITVFNAARIIKLYGTVAKKGDSTSERPHRTSKILKIPDKIENVLKDQLNDIVKKLPVEPIEQPKSNNPSNGAFDIEAWMKKYGLSIANSRSWNGGTLYQLDTCPFDSNHVKESSVIKHKSGAVSFQCFHNSCSNHDWEALRELKEPERKSAPKNKKVKQQIVEINIGESESIYTDMRNSKRLAKLVENKARYCSDMGVWMVHTSKIWESDTRGAMLRWAREVTKELQRETLDIESWDMKKKAINNALKCESLSRLKAMVELCQSEEGMSINSNNFDKNKMLFNVQNGTIDLNSGELLPHNPLDFITKISPVTYDPNAKCPRFMQFLDESLLFGDEDMQMTERVSHRKNIIAYLKRFSGYSLTGSSKEEQFLILYGDGGHGKSKYAGAIAYVMGTYHDKVDIATIQESSKFRDGSSPTPDIVKLKGLRFITTSEPEKGLKLNESRIKDFTGRDPVTGRALHQNPITFTTEFKMCVYTNYQIIIRGQDKSIWRRVHQVGFDCEPQIIDRDLDIKLQAEASGILNWMLDGCMEWGRDGLAVPKEITDAVEEYKDDMNTLSGFFELCCVFNKKDRNLKGLGKELFHVYQAWWQVDNPSKAPYFDKQFYGALHERGFKKMQKPSKNGVLIKGVRLGDEVREAYENAKTLSGGFNSEAVRLVTQYLVNFVATTSYVKIPENCLTSLTTSPNTPPDNDIEKNKVAPHTPVTDLCGFCEQPLNGDSEPGPAGAGPVHPGCKKKKVKSALLAKILLWYPDSVPSNYDDIAATFHSEAWKLGVTIPKDEARIAVINAFRERR